MTITALSKALGVSTPTIYRRLKAQGVNIDDLRDGGELTQHGVQVIASLFDRDDLVTQGVKRNVSDTEHEALHEALQGEMAVKIASLTAQVEGLQALVAHLEGERDALREQLTASQAALAAEIADRQAERRLLTGSTEPGEPDAQPRRRWRWPWQR